MDHNHPESIPNSIAWHQAHNTKPVDALTATKCLNAGTPKANFNIEPESKQRAYNPAEFASSDHLKAKPSSSSSPSSSSNKPRIFNLGDEIRKAEANKSGSSNTAGPSKNTGSSSK